jgi:hypothetical protein
MLKSKEPCVKSTRPPGETAIPTVKQFVIEREASKAASLPPMATCYNPAAVEGYTPRESIIEFSGKKSTLPELKPLKSVCFIENNDSCIEIHEKQDISIDDYDDENDTDDNDPVFGTMNDDDDLWSQTSEEPKEPRAFLLLWNTLADWVTPEAVMWFRLFHQNTSPSWEDEDQLVATNNFEFSTSTFLPNRERTDIEDTRCSGLSAMLHMHLSHCLPPPPPLLDELQHPEKLVDPLDIQRRLADFIRLFSFRNPTPRLTTKLWRAMTSILIDMVRHGKHNDKNESTSLPPSAIAVGLTIEEYTYLTKTCLLSFDADTSNLLNDTNE